MTDTNALAQNVIAVGSGKGGVGKSTVAVNLAVSLAAEGAAVGLLDADIHGPNIPIMMGIHEQPRLDQDRKLIPLERHGVKLMSVGFMGGSSKPVIWRGPLVGRMVKQFLDNVDWGALDYLLIDLPPGTGDAQLTLTQSVALTGGIIVSTPQDVALQDALRGMDMFLKVEVPVLGLIENMSYFLCPHCHERSDIFSHGGTQEAAEARQVPFLGALPLDTKIRQGGDLGVPIVVSEADSSHADCFRGMCRELQASIEKNRARQPVRTLRIDQD